MSEVNVLVAATASDVKAEGIARGIAASVDARSDMTLLRRGLVDATRIDTALESLPEGLSCALVLVGLADELDEVADRWLAERADLVVLRVDVVEDVVRISVRDPRMESLLTALRDLADRAGTEGEKRVLRYELRSSDPAPDRDAPAAVPRARARPLLEATIAWVHGVLTLAVESVPEDKPDAHAFSILALTRATLLQSLAGPAGLDPDRHPPELKQADAALEAALAAEPQDDPIATAFRTFELTALEFRMMLLTLAPDLDPRYQRCIGFLLDDLSRRVGTSALYCSLLGQAPRVREQLARSGGLARWLAIDWNDGRPTAADEPLRPDPFLVQWLLGESSALEGDPRVRHALRTIPWSGVTLLRQPTERALAATLLGRLQADAPWVLLGGDDPAGWRALLEVGARDRGRTLMRTELARLTGMSEAQVADSALRIGRLVRLTGHPLVVDASGPASEAEDAGVRSFFNSLAATGCHAALIGIDEARLVRLLGSARYERLEETALKAAHVAAVREAATGAGAYVTQESAEEIAARYPLCVDGLEHAMRLACGRPTRYDVDEPSLARFVAACRDVAAEGVSHLAERIEPVFSLDDVVLPLDRKEQLKEIVDNVRLAPRVLDEWKFREQLPYGRGVSALFFGPSGTGKTMAALGIARQLGIQLLRLDLSRIVSKYIGDTEKHVDMAFLEAHRSGSGILIDEAEALLGKRSEVKDAHDRYANIEVAYLLQRMELYEGLAILTTNLRQNIDPAFLRRLRFIVEFPRPDRDAREGIWRRCLPEGSHALDNAAFRQLARRIDLTGGNIRQITLRAAFIAAAAGALIGLPHIGKAARAELAKLGMPPVELDLGRKVQAA